MGGYVDPADGPEFRTTRRKSEDLASDAFVWIAVLAVVLGPPPSLKAGEYISTADGGVFKTTLKNPVAGALDGIAGTVESLVLRGVSLTLFQTPESPYDPVEDCGC